MGDVREVDNSDDAEWAVRLRHREAAAANVRNREHAQLLILVSTGEIPEEAIPTPPDPSDRTVGKRKWEKSIERWRHAIQDIIRPFGFCQQKKQSKQSAVFKAQIPQN